MARAKAEQPVKVRLACLYVGDGTTWGPGDVVEVDAEEAARLIAMGVAEAV